MPHADVSGQRIRFEDGGGDRLARVGGPDVGNLADSDPDPVDHAVRAALAGHLG